jgi:CMP-2-keto-3-deoxyoctulosonic acid synthetase
LVSLFSNVNSAEKSIENSTTENLNNNYDDNNENVVAVENEESGSLDVSRSTIEMPSADVDFGENYHEFVEMIEQTVQKTHPIKTYYFLIKFLMNFNQIFEHFYSKINYLPQLSCKNSIFFAFDIFNPHFSIILV